MANTPKDDDAKLVSTRLIRGIKWIARLPIVLLVWTARRTKRLFVTPGTEKELRVEEKARQAAIRRQLRGLPAEHDAGKPAP